MRLNIDLMKCSKHLDNWLYFEAETFYMQQTFFLKLKINFDKLVAYSIFLIFHVKQFYNILH